MGWGGDEREEGDAVHVVWYGNAGHVEDGGGQIDGDDGQRVDFHVLLDDVRRRDGQNEGNSDVRFVRQSLVDGHGELAQMVAVIRRDHHPRPIQLPLPLQQFHHPPNL